jgi:hypothetical protein
VKDKQNLCSWENLNSPLSSQENSDLSGLRLKFKMSNGMAVLTAFESMTKLLREAIAQIEKLPPDQQDAIAARFLAELQDEQKWEAQFAATTDDQWDRMAAMVREEIAKGETVQLEEVFPTQK